MLGEGPCVPSISHLPSPPPNTCQEKEKEEVMGLSTLPYDLLLNIATYLDLRDVHALHLTCSSLYDASTTRPVYRKLANDLLRRCRALPLKGFQRLSDLTTDKLIKAVNKATHYENAWRTRAPRPIAVEPYKNGISCHSNYMDVAPGGPLALQTEREGQKWYKIVSAPPDEEVDWLSPITSSYTLCATKSGKVVCWDVQTDTCLAEWNPGARWELWKCRVEFEERTVYFTMAKVLTGSYDDDRVMEFVLMRLTFSDGPSGESSRTPPIFSHVTEFRTTGVVMNVFLLDPSIRLLSAFIWVSTSNTIGLYALPDWNNKEYVFIDTGIECVMSSNWSCILYQQNIVIHCEESDAAYQHFYPLSLLRSYTATLDDTSATPVICGRVAPARTLKKKFIFPLIPSHDTDDDNDNLAESDADSEQDAGGPSSSSAPQNGGSSVMQTSLAPHNHSSYIDILLSMVPPSSQETSLSTTSSSSSTTLSSSSGPSSSSSSSSMVVSATLPPNPNPYPFPPWYPESAHFVRQWWPSLPNIPRVSCTVVLLAAHDQNTHRTRFVLAQHYFRVPLDHAEWENDPVQAGSSSNQKEKQPESSLLGSGAGATHSGNGTARARARSAERSQDDALMHLWYVSTPFEVVRVFDGPIEEDEDGATTERPRPLVAVDFGHAVWIEYVDTGEVDSNNRGSSEDAIDSDAKRLRFVTFPPFSEEYGVELDRCAGGSMGEVHTLETPAELDLGAVETINIDQSQGAVILSDKMGRIFILCYE